jgi:PAS domain S-box-containing protein
MTILATIIIALLTIIAWSFWTIWKDYKKDIEIQKQLRLSESRYRMIADNVTDVIWTMGMDERFTFASPAVKRILGYEVAETLTMKLENVLALSSYQSARLLITKHLTRPAGDRKEQDRNPVVAELEHVCKDGSTKWCEVSNLMLRDDRGNPTGLIGITRDISERKASQEKLLHYQKRLRALTSEISMVEQRERRKIAGDLHDRIGQTLAAAKIKLGTLKASLPSDYPTKDIIDITEMVNQTMQDTRTLTFELSPPILYELGLVAAVDWLLENVELKSGICCKLDSKGMSLKLNDDMRVLLFRIIRELIINVTKHAQARNLNITMKDDGDILTVEVVDDGEGFDNSQIRPEDFRTVGYGLFNARERLEHMGGQFTITSFPGKGTRVILSTPIEDSLREKPLRRMTD